MQFRLLPIQVILIVLCIVAFTDASRRELLQQAPGPGPTNEVICGDEDTQVTICFPGSQTAATCEYGLSEKSVSGISKADPCPDRPLFNKTCTALPGLLFIAYGPCQDQLRLTDPSGRDVSDGSTLPPIQDERPIDDWIATLGLRDLKSVGALYLRGYAYQPPQPVQGLDILPNLAHIGPATPTSLVGSQSTALTVLGAEIPRLRNIFDVGGGILIQNVPNTNFSGIFGPLHSTKGALFIAGNTRLTSLAGLENLNADTVGNLEILSNNLLSDISALSGMLGCDTEGQTTIKPANTLVGAVEVLPSNSNGTERCLLSTITQACSFIKTSACPTGTASAYNQFQTAKPSNTSYILAPTPASSQP